RLCPCLLYRRDQYLFPGGFWRRLERPFLPHRFHLYRPFPLLPVWLPVSESPKLFPALFSRCLRFPPGHCPPRWWPPTRRSRGCRLLGQLSAGCQLFPRVVRMWLYPIRARQCFRPFPHSHHPVSATGITLLL